jgi:hypothetical protein
MVAMGEPAPVTVATAILPVSTQIPRIPAIPDLYAQFILVRLSRAMTGRAGPCQQPRLSARCHHAN